MRNQKEISFWCVNLLSVYQRVTLYLFVALNYFAHHINLSDGGSNSIASKVMDLFTTRRNCTILLHSS